MNEFRYLSEEYKGQNTKQYRLSIQLNADGFSVLTRSNEGSILQLMHRNRMNTEEMIRLFKEDNEFLQLTHLSYERVVLLFGSPLTTLVPRELYEPGLKRLYFENLIPAKESELIMDSEIGLFDAILLFKLNEAEKRFLLLFRNEPEISHYSAFFPESHSSYPNFGNASFIYVNSGSVLQTCYRNGSLEFHGFSEWTEASDLVYHVLNVMKQVYGKPLQHPLYFSGIMTTGGEEAAMFKQYLKTVVPMRNELPFDIAGLASESFYTNLYYSNL